MRFFKKFSNLGFSITCLIITILFLVLTMFSWYVSNKQVSANGIRATTSTNEISIREIMVVKRYLNNQLVSTKEYHADDNRTYYEWDTENNQFKLSDGNKIPLGVASMFPNEYIDITMWYKSYIDGATTYKIGLTDIDDSNGLFTETVNGVEYTHTALGVFRVGEVTLDEDDKEVVSEWQWLADYNGDTEEDTKYSIVYFKSGDFSDTDDVETINNVEYHKATFRIQMNLTNYYNLTYTSTNMLSEKKVKIKEIRVIA